MSDAGAGGQVLLCESTFLAVKDLTGELGGVTEDGLDLDKLEKPPWWSWWRYAEFVKGRGGDKRDKCDVPVLGIGEVRRAEAVGVEPFLWES